MGFDDGGWPEPRTYTKTEVKKLLKKCWKAADSYREEIERINYGHSNFDSPRGLDRKEWIKKNLK